MAGKQPAFPEEEMAVDEGLGYPKAYARLCQNRTVLYPYNHGPPFDFIPYSLQPQEALRLKDFNHMFPVVDPEAAPSVNPRGYVNLLWKQLDHLGNAGFDPAIFRVDPYGNVLYLHADSASPLAWNIDHWFPCSRGGRTVPGNLRLLQWQVCDKKHNKLEFLIPWWDLQLGISVNQFLSIFASKNSDFRSRAFSFLFPSGRSEELNPLQAVDSHRFPRHFVEMKRQVGLAPAAIVSSRRSSDVSVLKPLNAQSSSIRPSSPSIVAVKFSGEEGDHSQSMAIQSFRVSKENTNPNADIYDGNPYLSISMARDSLRQREETKKKQTEISSLEDELNQLKRNNEADRVAIQELEALLVKKRRRAEKCRRLAEAQSSYKALLEKMIRDAMHQSVVYKEQTRLNQAATSALMARLEAQRAMCDSSENELRRKFKQRDEIEKQIRPMWELRKRSRLDDTSLEEVQNGSLKLLTSRPRHHPMKKELRRFLEEEQKVSDADLFLAECADKESEETTTSGSSAEKEEAPNSLRCYKDGFPSDEKYRRLAIKTQNCGKSCIAIPLNLEEEKANEKLKLPATATEEGECSKVILPKKQTFSHQDRSEEQEGSKRFEAGRDKLEIRTTTPALPKPMTPILQLKDSAEEDDEDKNRIGKGNLDKWLQILLKEAKEHTDKSIVEDLCDTNNRQEEVKLLRLKTLEEKAVHDRRVHIKKPKDGKQSESSRNEAAAMSNCNLSEKTNAVYGVGRKSFEVKEREPKPVLRRSDSARGFRSLPSSPSMIMRRGGADWICKKPQVTDDDEEEVENYVPASNSSNFIKTCTKAIKKVVNI